MRSATIMLRTTHKDDKEAQSEMVGLMIELARELSNRKSLADIAISHESGKAARLVILRGEHKECM